MICEFWLVSSFQITLRKSVEQLDEKHTIFGQGAQYFFASTPGSPSSIDSVRSVFSEASCRRVRGTQVEVTFDSSQVIAATRPGYLCGIFFEESWLQRGKNNSMPTKKSFWMETTGGKNSFYLTSILGSFFLLNHSCGHVVSVFWSFLAPMLRLKHAIFLIDLNRLRRHGNDPWAICTCVWRGLVFQVCWYWLEGRKQNSTDKCKENGVSTLML